MKNIFVAFLFFLAVPCNAFYEWKQNQSATDSFYDENPRTSPLNTGITGFWKLEEESGTRVDVVGSNDLTDTNTVTQEDGIVLKAGQFTAANSEYLTTTSPTSAVNPLDTDFSISTWYYLDTDANGVFIFSSGQSAFGDCYSIKWISQDATIRIGVNDSGGGGDSLDFTGVSPVTEGWHNAVMTYNTTTEEMRVIVDDGTPVSKTSDKDPCAGLTFNRFGLGARVISPGNYFNGRIDASGFWKKVLTASEITELYNKGAGVQYPF